MEGNYIIVDGHKIAIEAKIQIQSNNPLDDKDYVFISGNKVNEKGESSYPFKLVLSPADLLVLGMPHLLQSTRYNPRIRNVKLYSDGNLVDTGTLLLTPINQNLNTGNVTCDCIFFNPISDFLYAIQNKKVNELAMDGNRGVRRNGTRNLFLFNPADVTRQTTAAEDINFSDSLIDDVSTGTAEYAAQCVNNDDLYITFPSVRVLGDNSDDDTWINFWDVDHGLFPTMIQTPIPPTDGVHNYATYTYEILDNHIVPMYYLHQVVRHCFSEHGYTLRDEKGIIDDPFFKKQVLFNTWDIKNIYTVTLIQSDASARTTVYLERDTVIMPKNHLPDDTIQDFLLTFMQKFNCYFDFRGSDVFIRWGDFDTTDREITDYDPNIIVENTPETGISVSYDFPSDGMYDQVKDLKGPYNEVTVGDDSTIVTADNSPVLVDNKGHVKIYDPSYGITRIIEVDNILPYSNGTAVTEEQIRDNPGGASSDKSMTLKYPPVCHTLQDYQLENFTSTNQSVWIATTKAKVITKEVRNAQYVEVVTAGIVEGGHYRINPDGDDMYETEGPSSNGTVRGLFGVTVIYDGDFHDWIIPYYAANRDETVIIETGFYWGLVESSDFHGTGKTFPLITGYRMVYNNSGIAPGWFDLGLLGPHSLISVFWKSFINQFLYNQKITFKAYEAYHVTRAHKFHKPILIRGMKVYVTEIDSELPVRGEGVVYIGYKI